MQDFISGGNLAKYKFWRVWIFTSVAVDLQIVSKYTSNCFSSVSRIFICKS